MATTASKYTAGTAEVAETLGVSQRSVQRYVQSGIIDAIFDFEAGQWRIHRDYLNNNSRVVKQMHSFTGTAAAARPTAKVAVLV